MTYQSLAKQVELFDPVVDAALDWANVPWARDRWYVDVTVVEQHLYVVRTAEDERVLVVLVRQHDKFHDLPCVLHLKTTRLERMNVSL